MVDKRLALLPYSKKVLVRFPPIGQGLSMWILHVLLVIALVSFQCCGSPHHRQSVPLTEVSG